jgi:hypothetical protein
MVMSMGAYVGELIVRNAAGIWAYEPQTSAPGIKLRTGLLCFPLNKVGKRITVGPEHSIAQFVEAAMSGGLPPHRTARRSAGPTFVAASADRRTIRSLGARLHTLVGDPALGGSVHPDHPPEQMAREAARSSQSQGGLTSGHSRDPRGHAAIRACRWVERVI